MNSVAPWLVAVGVGLGASAASRAGDEAAPPPMADKVLVQEPGGEPREARRFSPVDGYTAEFELIFRFADREVVGESWGPSRSGPYVRSTVTATTHLSGDGGYTVNLRLEKPQADPTARGASISPRQVDQELEGLAGAVWTIGFDRRGRILDNTIMPAGPVSEAAKLVAQRLTDLLNSALSPLPDEAIGRGAKVRVERAGQLAGIPASLTQDVSVVPLISSGGKVLVRSLVTPLTPPPVEVKEGDPPRTTAEFTSSQDLIFDRPLPVHTIVQGTYRVVDVVKSPQGTPARRFRETSAEMSLRHNAPPACEARQPGEPGTAQQP